MKYCLAIDIGASSGRHIAGWLEDGKMNTREVYRFPNGVKEEDGHLTWDLQELLFHVKAGIDEAIKQFGDIYSLSVDTWGVDYVLMKGDKEILPCYSYRDDRTKDVVGRVHEKISFSELYRLTGIQYQPFNTIYQLYADKLTGRLKDADGYLMIPEYLMYKLCGGRSHEYTNATTGGMINAKTGGFDQDIIEALGFTPELFGTLKKPGTLIGEYKGIRVILCATHDTASAVEGIPMTTNEPYISSGTWSLLGVKTKEPVIKVPDGPAIWSNEGGVGYNRYQKNIMGMWIVNRLKEELCKDTGWDTVIEMAERSTYDETVDVNDGIFLAPLSMKAAFDEMTGNKPGEAGDYFRCAYRSLALCYRNSLEEMEADTAAKYECLYIVGGGAKNKFLNRLTEEFTGKKVIALPIEATALGNLKVQFSEGAVKEE